MYYFVMLCNNCTVEYSMMYPVWFVDCLLFSWLLAIQYLYPVPNVRAIYVLYSGMSGLMVIQLHLGVTLVTFIQPNTQVESVIMHSPHVVLITYIGQSFLYEQPFSCMHYRSSFPCLICGVVPDLRVIDYWAHMYLIT